MSWPNDMSTLVTEELNSTELWMVKEQMKAGHFKMVRDTGFADFSVFIIELVNGEQYRIENFFDEVSSVEKIE